MMENDVWHPLIVFGYVLNLTCIPRTLTAKSSRVMAFVVLAALVVQVMGITFYNRCSSGVCRGEHVFVCQATGRVRRKLPGCATG